MIPERLHFLYPVGLILFVSFILVGVWLNHSPEGRFETILDRIGAAAPEEIAGPLREAESYIRFQSKGFSPKPEDDSARPIADLYFQLGNALMSRSEPEWIDRSRACFETAVQLYPSLRQGWAFFQLGQIYEQQSDEDSWRQAQPYYERVSMYNSGDLSLRAGFRLASIALLLNESPIASLPLYDYIRFASRDAANDLSPFAAAAWDDRGEALYLRAFLAQNQGNRNAAEPLWNQYIERRPADYSARYHRARLADAPPSAAYPENGDLLVSCFAPRAFSDGQLLLLHNHHIRADYYVAQPDAHSLEISLDLENPFRKKLLLYVTVNDATRSLTLEPQRDFVKTFQFHSLQERNLIDFHVLMEGGDPSPSSPMWIRVRSLTARLAATEPSS